MLVQRVFVWTVMILDVLYLTKYAVDPLVVYYLIMTYEGCSEIFKVMLGVWTAYEEFFVPLIHQLMLMAIIK